MDTTRPRVVRWETEKECTGCKACFDACVRARGEGARIYLAASSSQTVPVACLECARAWCVQACPSGAFVRGEDGRIVKLEEDNCLRCGLCVLACPWGLIETGSNGLPLKCDGCPEWAEAPCVAVCPVGCLSAVEV